jgi:hypothetical protein
VGAEQFLRRIATTQHHAPPRGIGREDVFSVARFAAAGFVDFRPRSSTQPWGGLPRWTGTAGVHVDARGVGPPRRALARLLPLACAGARGLRRARRAVRSARTRGADLAASRGAAETRGAARGLPRRATGASRGRGCAPLRRLHGPPGPALRSPAREFARATSGSRDDQAPTRIRCPACVRLGRVRPTSSWGSRSPITVAC